ncbi:hypothetical protein [Acidovorax sp.]|jgi:hypothetical protein|uniref:hypothetical protein n=1 Tax=Acidovorax sp. TaxID=1872122 RepID=UPI0025C0736C|nr:hypothetical protein [Acidovorax sp.]MBL7087294.1 hypothetical protein [Acidovorax sp.]
MQPQPIMLYRRRWTLVFQVPFTLLVLACLAFSLYWAAVSNDRLLTILCLCAAFVAFCVGGTLGRSTLEAYRVRDPAVVIDATGITDLRQDDPHTVPWEAMERVHLDNYENVILVKLRPGHKDSALRVIFKALQRWQQRGDVVFFLGGLAYDTRQIQTALKAFHAAAAPKPRTL